MIRPGSEQYAVISVGHADDLTAEGLPFRHRRSPCRVRRAGSRWQVHVAHLDVPGGNEQQFDHTRRDEWIGGTPAPPPPP